MQCGRCGHKIVKGQKYYRGARTVHHEKCPEGTMLDRVRHAIAVTKMLVASGMEPDKETISEWMLGRIEEARATIHAMIAESRGPTTTARQRAERWLVSLTK